MTVSQMQEEIVRLKREKDICILAHSYQTRDIVEIADFSGDSFGLSRKAAEVPQNTVLMCGVRFMAETVKILSPRKRVFLSHRDAGCPMADQIDRDLVFQLKEKNPGYAVVCYINTTADTKTVCDVCVTSSSAVKIISKMNQKDIIFIPDCNLGAYVAKKVPEKNIMLVRGGCPTHLRITPRDVTRMRELYPDALVLVHPECLPSVVEMADYVGSTTGIMDYAKKSDNREFIIGTENSIVQHLQFDCPEKRFYPLSKDTVCHNMRLTTLSDVYNFVKTKAGEEITLDEQTIADSRRCIDEMLKLGA